MRIPGHCGAALCLLQSSTAAPYTAHITYRCTCGLDGNLYLSAQECLCYGCTALNTFIDVKADAAGFSTNLQVVLCEAGLLKQTLQVFVSQLRAVLDKEYNVADAFVPFLQFLMDDSTLACGHALHMATALLSMHLQGTEVGRLAQLLSFHVQAHTSKFGLYTKIYELPWHCCSC